jgi:hypothetical protein
MAPSEASPRNSIAAAQPPLEESEGADVTAPSEASPQEFDCGGTAAARVAATLTR